MDAVGYSNPVVRFDPEMPENGQSDGMGSPRVDFHRIDSVTQPPAAANRSQSSKAMAAVWSLLEEIMPSGAALCALELWSLAELLLCWVFAVAILQVPYSPTGPVYVLLLLFVLKTVLYAAEVLCAMANSVQMCHRYSLVVTGLLQGLLEPLIEIPTAITLLHGSFCYFLRKLLLRSVVQGKLWIGLVHVLVMVLKWAIQIRYLWMNCHVFKRRSRCALLAILAFITTVWMISFRLWYLRLAYNTMGIQCYL